MELTFKRDNKKEEKPTITSELGELNYHIFVDRDYYESKENIESEFNKRLEDDKIQALGLSDKKQMLMVEVKETARYAWFHVPRGKAGHAENSLFARKMQAARRLLLRSEEIIQAGASDEDTELVVRDILHNIDILVGFTFDKENTSVIKSFAYQGLPTSGGASGWLDPDTKEAMKAFMTEKAAREAAEKNGK